jgi:hypothetical protein
MPSAAGKVFCFDGVCPAFGVFAGLAADDVAAVLATCDVFGRLLTGIFVSNRKRKKMALLEPHPGVYGLNWHGGASTRNRRGESEAAIVIRQGAICHPLSARTKSIRIKNILFFVSIEQRPHFSRA